MPLSTTDNAPTLPCKKARQEVATRTSYPMDTPTALPPVRDSFPKPIKKHPSKNYSYKILHKKDKVGNIANVENGQVVDNVHIEDNNVKITSPFYFDKDDAAKSNSKSYRPVHGLKYLQNYKSMLKQRGVRYQEIFGHTPRKPEERAGLKVPTLNGETNKDNHTFDTYSEHLKSVTERLPDIYTKDSDNLSNTDYGYDLSIKSKENSVAMTTRYDTDEDFLDSISRNDEESLDSVGRMLNENLNDIIWKDSLNAATIPNRRSPRRKGKLGDLMTPRHMEKLLESKEAMLKFEEGLGYPYEK